MGYLPPVSRFVWERDVIVCESAEFETKQGDSEMQARDDRECSQATKSEVRKDFREIFLRSNLSLGVISPKRYQARIFCARITRALA
jgi:hypothetical protein